MFGKRFFTQGLWAALALAAVLARAETPTAAINASPVTGPAPLGTSFDASASSPDATTFFWDFGDGGVSTAKNVTHIYTVAGTYVATLTVTNAAGQSASSQVVITVTGSSAGPVTSNANFRWVITTASFALNPKKANKDALTFRSVFNTVDLPARVDNLAVSFSINNSFTITGILSADGSLLNPERRKKPTYSLQLDVANQLLNVAISKAELKAALALSGAGDATIPRPGIQVPVTFYLTIGAQTYSLTEGFTYTATAGASGKGKLNLKQKTGSVVEGFFAIARASALENSDGTGHFFQFDGYLARPLGALVGRPASGTFVFKFHEADRIVLPFDRLRGKAAKINYVQSERALGGLRKLTIDTSGRHITIQTWDIPADATNGGTGLPIRGQFFLSFNFALRLELDQPDGTTFQVVTATTLTRHTKDDAFWQTGRRK